MRWDVDGPAGTWSFMPGSKGALWNGIQVWLGFEPRLLAGRLSIHRLDVDHHLAPLASDQTAPPWGKRTVVLDPGHGGRNAGTRSIAGNRFEKEFTLDCAQRLAEALRKKGWTVSLTRTNDADLSLTERVQTTDAAAPDLFISLHFNSAFPGREPAGLETYTVTPQGMTSHVTRNYPDDPTVAFPANRWNDRSLRAATSVHRAVLAGTGMTDRGVRHARFLDVLRWQDRTAILVECGYLSNPAEASRIQSAEFRQRLADAIAAGVD